MRLLTDARVAPHWRRLLAVIPPERSQYLAAAGLHGLSSFKSNAFAAVSDNANRPAATRHFIIPGPFFGVSRRLRTAARLRLIQHQILARIRRVKVSKDIRPKS